MKCVWNKIKNKTLKKKTGYHEDSNKVSQVVVVDFSGLGLTFVLGSELLHVRRQRLIEALLSADQRLAHRVVIVTHHAGVAPHLQTKSHQALNNKQTNIQQRPRCSIFCLYHVVLVVGHTNTAQSKDVSAPVSVGYT